MTEASIRDLVTYQMLRDAFKRSNIHRQALEDELSDTLIAAIDYACKQKGVGLERAYLVIGAIAKAAGLDKDAARKIMLPLLEG